MEEFTRFNIVCESSLSGGETIHVSKDVEDVPPVYDTNVRICVSFLLPVLHCVLLLQYDEVIAS